MRRLIITADIHGSYHSWLTIKALMQPDDGLVVAGDLFDTRYGSYSDSDFSPYEIRKDLKYFVYPFYYVYGNCDSENFTPGYKTNLIFTYFGKKIYLHHGHRLIHTDTPVDIVIQGHTHLCSLEKTDCRILMNPGSISKPRNSLATYGVMDDSGIRLVELKTSKVISNINF